jgi:hypothetical protein
MNEFKTFAIDKDIPVLTNSHLNRDAARTLEEAERKGNQDTGKLIGKSNVGESMLMIENVDCSIVITLDFDKDQNRYMCFKLTKMRDDDSRNYIAQPFAIGSKIRLMEDLGGIPQFRDSIHQAPEVKRITGVKVSGVNALCNDFNDVLEVTEDDKKDNAFAEKSSYTLNDSSDINNNISDMASMLQQNNIEQPIDDDQPQPGKLWCPIRIINNQEKVTLAS